MLVNNIESKDLIKPVLYQDTSWIIKIEMIKLRFISELNKLNKLHYYFNNLADALDGTIKKLINLNKCVLKDLDGSIQKIVRTSVKINDD